MFSELFCRVTRAFTLLFCRVTRYILPSYPGQSVSFCRVTRVGELSVLPSYPGNCFPFLPCYPVGQSAPILPSYPGRRVENAELPGRAIRPETSVLPCYPVREMGNDLVTWNPYRPVNPRPEVADEPFFRTLTGVQMREYAVLPGSSLAPYGRSAVANHPRTREYCRVNR